MHYVIIRISNKQTNITYRQLGLAQLVERRTTEQEVAGSSPRPDQHSGS